MIRLKPSLRNTDKIFEAIIKVFYLNLVLRATAHIVLSTY